MNKLPFLTTETTIVWGLKRDHMGSVDHVQFLFKRFDNYYSFQVTVNTVNAQHFDHGKNKIRFSIFVPFQ